MLNGPSPMSFQLLPPLPCLSSRLITSTTTPLPTARYVPASVLCQSIPSDPCGCEQSYCIPGNKEGIGNVILTSGTPRCWPGSYLVPAQHGMDPFGQCGVRSNWSSLALLCGAWGGHAPATALKSLALCCCSIGGQTMAPLVLPCATVPNTALKFLLLFLGAY